MLDIKPEYLNLLETEVRKMDAARTEGRDVAEAQQMAKTMRQLADLVNGSDTLQKSLMATEIQILRSKTPEVLTSCLMFHTLIGLILGAKLRDTYGDAIFSMPELTNNEVN